MGMIEITIFCNVFVVTFSVMVYHKLDKDISITIFYNVFVVTFSVMVYHKLDKDIEIS